MTSQSAAGHRLEVVTDPASLPEDRCRELIDAFVELSARTTGGEDWRSYRPAVEGWREYYNARGARPQDYDRLVLIYDGDRLIHFTGVVELELSAAPPLIYIRSAMTLKEYHGAGLLKTSILTVFSPAWLEELATAAPEVFFTMRTANPIVYEAARNLVSQYAASRDLEFSLFPQIGDGGRLEAVPESIRALAVRTAEKTSPGCLFIPETFVNKGYFKMYGALYKEPVFPCRTPSTQQFFEREVDYTNQDGILILIRMQRRTTAAATGVLRAAARA